MVTYNELVVLDFTEKEVNDRGASTWGANYVYNSGGLQNDITLIAHKFDYGYAPAASGIADIGASGNPFRAVYTDRLVAGDADASGAIYLYGDQPVGEKLLYALVVNTSDLTVKVQRAPEVGTPQFGD